MRKKLGLVLIIVVLCFIVYNSIFQIFGAFKAGDRLTEAAKNLKNIEIKNKELKKQLEQASTIDFIEIQARNKLGLVKPGETVVIIPQNKLQAVLGAAKEDIDQKRFPNPVGWLKLFLR